MDKQMVSVELERAGFAALAGEAGRFALLLNELADWNEKFNLTAITDPREMIIKHVIDSLQLVKYDNSMDKLTIIDIGTGAGFPALPLAIALPGCRFFLNESNSKKALFLRHAAEVLGTANAQVLPGRAEELAAEPRNRGKFDRCVMRALASLPVALELCAGFIRDKGRVHYYASAKQAAELVSSEHAMKELGFGNASVHHYELPDAMGSHAIVTVEKLWKTPAKYPRQYGIIKKKPL